MVIKIKALVQIEWKAQNFEFKNGADSLVLYMSQDKNENRALFS